MMVFDLPTLLYRLSRSMLSPSMTARWADADWPFFVIYISPAYKDDSFNVDDLPDTLHLYYYRRDSTLGAI